MEVVEGKCRQGRKRKQSVFPALGVSSCVSAGLVAANFSCSRSHICVPCCAFLFRPQRARRRPLTAQTGSYHMLFNGITCFFCFACFVTGSSTSSTLSLFVLLLDYTGTPSRRFMPRSNEYRHRVRLQLSLSSSVCLSLSRRVRMCMVAMSACVSPSGERCRLFAAFSRCRCRFFLLFFVLFALVPLFFCGRVCVYVYMCVSVVAGGGTLAFYRSSPSLFPVWFIARRLHG